MSRSLVVSSLVSLAVVVALALAVTFTMPAPASPGQALLWEIVNRQDEPAPVSVSTVQEPSESSREAPVTVDTFEIEVEANSTFEGPVLLDCQADGAVANTVVFRAPEEDHDRTQRSLFPEDCREDGACFRLVLVYGATIAEKWDDREGCEQASEGG
jgi:hypothetical protein